MKKRWWAILCVAVALGAVAAGGSTFLPSRQQGNQATSRPVPGYGGPVSALETPVPGSAAGSVNELEAAQAPSQAKRISGSFIVGLAPGQDPHQVAMSIARDYGGEAGAIYDEVIDGFQFLGPDSAGKKMASDPRIRSVQPDYVAYTAESSAVTHLHADDAPCVTAGTNQCGTPWYTLGATGSGETIGILDTGADLTNQPDIDGNIDFADSTDASSGVCNAKNGSAQDLNGHGTRTTSNAVGAIGVAPNATAVIVKVFPGSGSSTSFSNIACGVNYLVHLNRNTSTHVVAVNASIAGSGPAGTCTDGSLRQAVCQLVDGTNTFQADNVTPINPGSWAQAAFFAAAGNTGGSASGIAPARYPETMAVSAFDCDSVDCVSQNPKVASFSSRGSTIAIGAPGVNIWSAKLDGGHEIASGTSRSSPQATGAAADLVSAGVPVTQIRSVLQAGGRCPLGSPITKNSAGNCASGTWASDGDGFTEPFLDVQTAINTFTPPTPTAPGAPTNVTAVAGNAQATLSWAAPPSNGRTITKYTVTSSPDATHASGITQTVTGSPPATNLTFTGLTNDTSYTFIVFATNSIGNGPNSSPSNSVMPHAPRAPDPPTGVQAVAGNASATVSWTPPGDNGGDPITSYTATSNPGGLHATTTSGTQTSVVVTGLTNGQLYNFTVVATNSIGNSSGSSASNSVTPNAHIFYSQNFDGSTSGWTTSNSSATVHWRLNNSCPGVNSHSPNGFAVWYGNPSTCDYAGTNSAKLTSPVITMSPTPSHYQIQFLAKRDVRSCSGCTDDQTVVAVDFQDGGGFRTIYTADAGHAPSSPGGNCINLPADANFDTITCNLGNATGKVQVRWSFNSVTSAPPGHIGWSIDDFSVHL